MTNQRPKFKLEDIDMQPATEAKISNQAYASPCEEISRERTFDCSCDIDCSCYGAPAC